MSENSLYVALLSPDEGIESCIREFQSPNFKDKVRAIHTLGTIQNRNTYPILLEILKQTTKSNNWELASQSIISLGQIKDSRVLFPLVNYFNRFDNSIVQKRILQSIYHMQDPRAEDFLKNYISQQKTNSLDIAIEALKVCCDNANFVYRFNSSEEDRREAKQITGQIEVFNNNLTDAEEILKQNTESLQCFKPHTYIIGEDKKMLVGGEINEHVRVARGRDVLAAGEITFSKEGKNWEVDYINHRSCGYFPAKGCFKWVKDFFEQSDVKFMKNRFDEPFPREGYNDPDFLLGFKFGEKYY